MFFQSYDQGKIPSSALFGATPFGLEPWAYIGWWHFGDGKALAEGIYARHDTKPLLCGISEPETAGWFRTPLTSIMLVVMADRMSMSVGDLFLGAVFPGVLLGGLYIVYLLAIGWFKPGHAPAVRAQPMTLRAAWDLAVAVVPAALLILAVLGSIFFGLATPTEAAGVGAVGALLLAALKGTLSRKVMAEVVEETSRTSAFIFGAIIGAVCFTLVLRGLGGSFRHLPDQGSGRTVRGRRRPPDSVRWSGRSPLRSGCAISTRRIGRNPRRSSAVPLGFRWRA